MSAERSFGLRWVLDVVFDENESRIRKGEGAANFALLCRIALNLLRSEDSKLSLNRKRLRAGWDEAYWAKVLHIQQPT